MSFRQKLLLALPVLLAAYLAVAACWAWVTFDEALAAVRPAQEARLSPVQTRILMLVEDPTFFEHAGVSLAKGQGFATISSALARELYLGETHFQGAAGMLQRLYRGVFACCRKLDLGRDAMAVVLDVRLSKERQLALYVSRVYMGGHGGRQIRGLPDAASSLLGKPLAETTDDEFIGLVAMIQAPNHFHPVRNPAAYRLRVARIRALVAGACQPGGWFDTALEHCAAAAARPFHPSSS